MYLCTNTDLNVNSMLACMDALVFMFGQIIHSQVAKGKGARQKFIIKKRTSKDLGGEPC